MNLGIKILVAEDDPNLGTILRAYLQQKGYTVFLAIDGQMALDFYKQEEIDVCVLDVMMPIKDGFTVAKEIRRIDKRIPLLFLSVIVYFLVLSSNLKVFAFAVNLGVAFLTVTFAVVDAAL